MKTINLIFAAIAFIAFAACNSDDEEFQVPASEGAILDVPVGGPTQPNQVFIDLSTDTQTTIDRSTWDLGFYNGDQFSVILNAASEVMARDLNETSFSAISKEDYEEFAELMTVDAIFGNLFAPPPYPEWMAESSNWIDDPEGDLAKTAIAPISANENENSIYLINRGFNPDETSRGSAMLVKVMRSANGYTLQYQELGSESVETMNIEKTDSYNFVFFNFDSGTVDVEPEKDSWDIVFTNHMEKLDVGTGMLIPYTFQDYVLQNRNGVTIAEMVIEESEDLFTVYENFTLADVGGLEFDDAANTIGSSWRTVANPTPGSVTGVRTDGFYILKDLAGNQYKILFTGMLNETGERGYPEITYELLK